MSVNDLPQDELKRRHHSSPGRNHYYWTEEEFGQEMFGEGMAGNPDYFDYPFIRNSIGRLSDKTIQELLKEPAPF